MESVAKWRAALMRTSIVAIVTVSLALGFVQLAAGFGKNKLIHRTLHWRMQRTAHLEIYYYPEASGAVPWVAAFAEEAAQRISGDLGLAEPEDKQELEKPLPLVLYLNRRDFEQTRIYPGFIVEGIRGFSEPWRGRMVIPLDGPRRELEELIVHEMTHLLTYRATSYSALGHIASGLPLWFLEGLAEHETGTWTALDEAVLRDAVLRGPIPPISRLSSFENLAQPFLGYVMGHLALDLIEERYGRRAIPQILNELRRDRARKSVSRAIFRTLKLRPNEFDQLVHQALMQRYARVLEGKDSAPELSTPWPPDDTRAAMLAPAVSPAGELVAHFTNARGPLEIAISQVRDGRRFRTVASTEGSYELLSTEGKPLAWSPDGDLVAFFAVRGARDLMVLWDLARNGERERIDTGLDRSYALSFAPDAGRVAVAGSFLARPDLYIYDRRTGTSEPLTKDEHFDTEPAWSPDGRRVAYSSERSGLWSLVVIDVASRSERILVSGAGMTLQPAWAPDGKRLYFVWDRTGIENLYELDPDRGAARRLTDVVGRALHPCPLPGGDLLYVEYRDQRYALRRIPTIGPGYETVEPITVPPVAQFVSTGPTNLPLMEARTPKWRAGLQELSWSAGLTDDQRLLLGSTISFSDLFAERQLSFSVGTDSVLPQIAATYTHLRRSLELSFGGGYRRDNVFFRGDRQVQSQLWGQFIAVRPFNRELRLEGRLVASRTENSEPFGVYGTDPRSALALEAGLIDDSVRYVTFGPLEGTRYRLEGAFSIDAGSLLQHRALAAEIRHYDRVARRGVLATRLSGGLSFGDDPIYFSLGGTETIPGLSLDQLTGENYALGNVELRFPLIDHIGFATGWSLRSLRGTIFVAAGTAFDDFNDVVLWENDPKFRLVDLKFSFGARATVRFGRLDLRLTAGWPTDFTSVESQPEVTFTIGSGAIY